MLTLVFCLLPWTLHASGSLTGVIHTATGATIEKAQVAVHDVHGDHTGVTDARGAFTIADVALPATIDVSAPGFAPIHRTVTTSPVDLALDPAPVTESVVVNADKSPMWRDPASGATVLNRNDLQLLPATTLDESLRAVSGFSLFRRSSAMNANPTTQGVTMRGLSASGASRGLVLLDGVPLNDGFGGWVTWTRLPDAAAQRVDVNRGAAGDAFGSDALGGVIRIVTPRVDQTVASAGVEGGSAGLARLDLSGGQRRGRVSYFGALTALRTDGYIPTAPEVRGPVDVPADANWENGFGRLDVAFLPTRRLTVEGWGGRDDRGNGTPIQRNRMSGGTGAVTFEGVGNNSTLTARLSVSPNSFYQTFSTVASNRATETLTSTQTVDPDTLRGIVEFGRTLPHALVMVRGSFTHASGTFTDVRPATTINSDFADDNEGISAEAGWTPSSRLTFDAGIREEWRQTPDFGTPGDSATVGHVGGVWQIAQPVSFRASVASSHRWPTMNELLRDFQAGNTLTLANRALQPEEAKSVDAALFVTGRTWLVSAGGFHTIVDNVVANVTQPAGTVPGFSGIVRQRQNAGIAHATGAEIDGEVRPTRSTRLRGSVTLLHTKLTDSPELVLNGNRLPQVPRVSGSLSGDVTVHRSIVGSFVWHAVSNQFDDDRNQFLLAPAYQLDLRVAGRVRTLEWHVVLENALDARIETGRTSATLVTVAPGRAVRVGLTWRR